MADRVSHPVVAEILGMFTPIGPDLANLVVPLKNDQHALRALNDLERKSSKLPVDSGTLRRTIHESWSHFVSPLRVGVIRVPVVIKFFLRPREHGIWRVPI